MTVQFDRIAMNARILKLKETATDLSQMAEGFPAIAKNTARILSSTKMLEINLSDLLDLEEEA